MDERIFLKDKSREELRQWQLALLDILIYFSDFCKDHGLRYFISGGTLIGAVRHKGFIPWDDDIDVIMPREDYEKLHLLWDKEADTEKYSCCRTTKDQSIGVQITLIKSNYTTCIFPYSVNLDICQGMKIDVLPYDGCPSNPFKGNLQKICIYGFSLFSAQRVPNHGGKVCKVLAFVLLKIFRWNKIRYFFWHTFEKYIKKFRVEDYEEVRRLSLPPDKREWVDSAIELEFEGHLVSAPIGYHELLKNEYGDYMQMPPEEERYPLTFVSFYDLHKGYKEYKGIQYCKEKR